MDELFNTIYDHFTAYIQCKRRNLRSLCLSYGEPFPFYSRDNNVGMGAFLAKPNVDKHSETGQNNGVRYAVTAMQVYLLFLLFPVLPCHYIT